MRHVAILLRPLLAGTSTRVDVRVADGPNADAFALMGQAWEPAVSRRPSTSQELMSPDLDGKVQPGKATFEILMAAILAVQFPATLIWHGAPVTIYGEQNEQDLGATPEFTGTITSASFDDQYASLSVTAEVSTAAFDVNFLKLDFDGSGGLGGDAAKRGTLKPAGMGVCKNCEPVWFDETRNIGMLDGYNNLASVQGLYEGRSSLGASVGDYVNYAALAAAIDSHAVPPGRWATCIADGLVGLGAPPTGRVTADATFGTNRAGAMIRRVLQTHCGISSGIIDTAAFNALDTTVNVPMHYWTADQRNAKDLIERIAGGCNATPIVNFQGKITITRGLGGANAGTLNRDGSTVPRVLDWRSAETDAPWWQLKARVARPGVVMTRDEINYEDTIVDRGLYNSGTVYRLGNVVWLADKSSWLYTNPTATSGNAPPLSGAFPASNAYWFQQTPRLGALANEDTVDWSDTTGIPFEQINNNLLDMTAWKVGRGRNPAGRFDRFILNETTGGTNALVLDRGPFGLSEPMIRAISQAGDIGGAAGGWNYEYGGGNEVVDPKQTYQLAVWIRMDSATNFYLGCAANLGGIKNLGGTVDTNPYHIVGMLPQTGKWYLAVGVVHGHGYTGGQSGLSGLWDPATGRRVFEGVDFKFADATPTVLVHRTYQYYPAAAGRTASFARPRLDAANGNQPSVEQLLSNARSEISLRALYTGSSAPFPEVVGNRVRWGNSAVPVGTGPWDAGAVGDIAADGACSVGGYIAVDRTVLMIGLTDQAAPGPYYSALDYAIYCTDSNGGGLYLIYEDGSSPFASSVVPAAGDFCFVWSNDVVVKYYVRHAGGALTLLYTSASDPRGKKLRPMVSLAYGGIENIVFNIGNSVQWDAVGPDGKPEDNADVTATAKVAVEITTDRTVAADSAGTVTPTNLSAVAWAPRVTKGGVSIRADNNTTYAVSGASGGTFAVDNTNGSADKGQVTISAMTANTATVDLTITVNGVAEPKITLRLVKDIAPATGGGGGGGTGKMISYSSGDFAGINVTSPYTSILTGVPKTLTVASGESLYGDGTLDIYVSGSGAVTRTGTLKWQYAVTGSGSWNDFGSGITSSTSRSSNNSGPPDYETTDPIPGSLRVQQTKSGLAPGTYDIRLVGICSATGRFLSFYGTATCEAKP